MRKFALSLFLLIPTYSAAAFPSDPCTEFQENHSNSETRTASEISCVILKNGVKLNAAYQRSLRKNPKVGGKVVVKFTIEPDGTVSSPAVTTNETGSAELAIAVVEVISRLHWPERKTETWSGDHTLNFFSE